MPPPKPRRLAVLALAILSASLTSPAPKAEVPQTDCTAQLVDAIAKKITDTRETFPNTIQQRRSFEDLTPFAASIAEEYGVAADDVLSFFQEDHRGMWIEPAGAKALAHFLVTKGCRTTDYWSPGAAFPVTMEEYETPPIVEGLCPPATDAAIEEKSRQTVP